MRNLLIVDDERTIREGLSRSLHWEQLGISDVRTAANGAEALALLRSGHFDMVVTDIVMPELSGLELISQCQAENIRPEFIILSSYDDFRYAQQAIKSGVCEYLLKPCHPEELRAILETLIRRLDLRDHSLQDPTADQTVRSLLPHARSQLLHELLTLPPENISASELARTFQVTPGHYQLLVMPLKCASEGCVGSRPLLTLLASKRPDMLACTEQGRLVVLVRHARLHETQENGRLLQSCGAAAGFPEAPVLLSEPLGLSDIYRTYRKTEDIFRLLWYFGPHELIHLPSVRLTLRIEDVPGIPEALQSLDASAAQNQTVMALDHLNRIFALFREHKLAFRAVHEACHRMYLSMINQLPSSDSHPSEKLSSMNQISGVGQLYDLLVQEISRLVVSREEVLMHACSTPTRTALEYISKNLSDPGLSLQFIAGSVLYLNPDYFGKLFRKECGVKFNHYLLALRMKKARYLLRNTDLSISAVASEVGFGDHPTYFSQQFRKDTGLLPKEYKSSLLKPKAAPGSRN